MNFRSSRACRTSVQAVIHGFPAAACLSMAESRGLSDFRLQWALFAQKMRADPMKSPAYEPSSSRP